MAQARRALSHRGLWLVGAGLALASLGVPGCGTDAGEPPDPMWTSGTGGQGGSGSPGGGRPSAGSKATTPKGGTSDGGDAGAGAYAGQSDAGENGGGSGGAAGSGGTGGAGMGGTAGMSGGGTGGMSGTAGMSGSSGASGAGGVSGAGGSGGMSGAAGMSGSAGTSTGGTAGTGGTGGGGASTGGGGASTGGGGASTGGGGASTGGGGASTGGGGASTGGGGASTGGGGASTGGGGASTGGGGSGPGYVCGDGMEEGDECETTNTPLCTDDCKRIATDQCVECENNTNCFSVSDSCNFNNDTGESLTPEQREACYDVASCIRDTGCGNGANDFTSCFCAGLATPQCVAAPISGPGSPTGVCAPIIRQAMAGAGEDAATLTNKQILERFLKPEYPGGAAIARWNCDKKYCQTECDLD